MVKIRTFADGIIPDGTLLEAEYIDHAGDACLNDSDNKRYGRRWVFEGNYIVINEESDEQRFELTLQVKDLFELHDLFITLPRTMIETAKLDKL